MALIGGIPHFQTYPGDCGWYCSWVDITISWPAMAGVMAEGWPFTGGPLKNMQWTFRIIQVCIKGILSTNMMSIADLIPMICTYRILYYVQSCASPLASLSTIYSNISNVLVYVYTHIYIYIYAHNMYTYICTYMCTYMRTYKQYQYHRYFYDTVVWSKNTRGLPDLFETGPFPRSRDGQLAPWRRVGGAFRRFQQFPQGSPTN